VIACSLLYHSVWVRQALPSCRIPLRYPQLRDVSRLVGFNSCSVALIDSDKANVINCREKKFTRWARQPIKIKLEEETLMMCFLIRWGVRYILVMLLLCFQKDCLTRRKWTTRGVKIGQEALISVKTVCCFCFYILYLS
jgi:hypothetical protein